MKIQSGPRQPRQNFFKSESNIGKNFNTETLRVICFKKGKKPDDNQDPRVTKGIIKDEIYRFEKITKVSPNCNSNASSEY